MHNLLRKTGVLSVVALCAGLMIVSTLATAAQRADAVRLYALDGGTLTIGDPTVFGLTREDVPDLTTMPVPAFLIVHPKGALLWDTGLGDQLIGRPASETRRGAMGQAVTKPLKEQLTAIGYPPEKIHYLGLSHLYHHQAERTLKKMPAREAAEGVTARSRAALESFISASGAQLWIQHDPATWLRLKKAPAFYD